MHVVNKTALKYAIKSRFSSVMGKNRKTLNEYTTNYNSEPVGSSSLGPTAVAVLFSGWRISLPIIVILTLAREQE